jgi:hypothetical protein
MNTKYRSPTTVLRERRTEKPYPARRAMAITAVTLSLAALTCTTNIGGARDGLKELAERIESSNEQEEVLHSEDPEYFELSGGDVVGTSDSEGCNPTN